MRNEIGKHLAEFDLINMNGRVYDPILGRFLSPDPYVQFPGYANAFNRYAYCLNNPLVYTDPDGEFIFPMALFIIGSGILWAEFNRPSKGHSDYGNYTFNDWIGNFGKGAIMGGGMVLPLTLAPPTFFGGILATGRTILPTITGSFSLGPFQYNPGYDQFGFGIGPVSYSSGTGWDYIFDGDNTFWEDLQYGFRTLKAIQNIIDFNKKLKIYKELKTSHDNAQEQVFYFASYDELEEDIWANFPKVKYDPVNNPDVTGNQLFLALRHSNKYGDGKVPLNGIFYGYKYSDFTDGSDLNFNFKKPFTLFYDGKKTTAYFNSSIRTTKTGRIFNLFDWSDPGNEFVTTIFGYGNPIKVIGRSTRFGTSNYRWWVEYNHYNNVYKWLGY